MPLARSALFYWVLLFALAALNGAARDVVLAPIVEAVIARPLSALTLTALLAVAIGLYTGRRPSMGPAAAITVGIGWLGLTLLGEALLNVANGRPAAALFDAFTWKTIVAAEWLAVPLVFVAVAPALFIALRKP